MHLVQYVSSFLFTIANWQLVVTHGRQNILNMYTSLVMYANSLFTTAVEGLLAVAACCIAEASNDWQELRSSRSCIESVGAREISLYSTVLSNGGKCVSVPSVVGVAGVMGVSSTSVNWLFARVERCTAQECGLGKGTYREKC